MNKNWLNITLIGPDCSPLVTVACFTVDYLPAGEARVYVCSGDGGRWNTTILESSLRLPREPGDR